MFYSAAKISVLLDTDLTLTTERLVELFASANNQDIEVVSELYLETPLLKQLRFQMKYQNPAKRKEAYLDHYVHNHPVASWTMIAQALHVCRLSEEAAMVENTYIHGILYRKVILICM